MIKEREGDDDRIQINFDKQKVVRAFWREGQIYVEIEGAGLYRIEAEKEHMIENGMVLLMPVVKTEFGYANDDDYRARMLDWGGIMMRGDDNLSFWADATNNPQLVALVKRIKWEEPTEEFLAAIPRIEEGKPIQEMPLTLPPPAPPKAQWYKGV